MRVTAHGLAATLTALAAALIVGCGEPAGPRVGTLVVTVTTSGPAADLDLDGYSVVIDDLPAQNVAMNDALTVVDFPTGNHVVNLLGVAPNCTVNGDDSQSVRVTGSTTTVSFFVTCIARNGTVRISTTTTGPEPDADGYSVSIGGIVRSGIPANGNFDIPGIAIGDYPVELFGVAGNCTVDAPHPRTITVTNGAVVPVTLVIRCVPSVSLRVTASTTGVFLDANGYDVRVARDGHQVASARVPANGSVTLLQLQSATYEVTLHDIAANCDVTTSNRRAVAVSGTPTPISIDIVCEAPRQLAYAGFNNSAGDIYVIRSNGTENFRLTVHAAADYGPAWSPDGNRIAFASLRDGNPEIYVMNAGGENQVRLTNAPGSDESPTWSPDGSKIAFVSNRDGNTEIYVMNADGTNLVRLTNDVAVDADPAWSPDGSKIAFRTESGSPAAIWVMNADGTGRNQLTSSTSGDYQPAWSPDGTKMAFSRGVGPYTRDIFVMNADGSGVTRLTSGYEDAEEPSWSPDGRKIAFTSYSYYYNLELVIVSLEGIPYTTLSTPNGTNPSWRP